MMLVRLFVLCFIIYSARAVMFTIKPNSQKCLKEDIQPNQLVKGEYEVSDIHGQIIDYIVRDTNGHILSRGEQLSKGKFTFMSEVYDTYEICFTSKVPPPYKIGALTEYLQENYISGNVDLTIIIGQADKAIQESQRRNERYFQRTHKPVRQFEVGEFVVDTSVGKNKKLVPKYKGPYVIHKQLEHDRYVVTDIENCQLTQIPYSNVIDSSRLRRWVQSNPSGEILAQEGNNSIDQEEEFIDLQCNDKCIDLEYLKEHQVESPESIAVDCLSG